MKTDRTLLEAALVGYQAKLTEIQAAMSAIRSQLGNKPAAAATAPAKEGRRKMSAAGRRRIAAAQKKRWAEYKKAQGSKG